MSREDIRKLLGGYASDTLTESERRALFEAALEDQALFDELAKEQALREVFQDAAARRQLLEALGPARETARPRAWPWLRRPAGLALAGALAGLLIVSAVLLERSGVAPQQAHVLVARAPLPPPPAPPAAPAPAPMTSIAALPKAKTARQLYRRLKPESSIVRRDGPPATQASNLGVRYNALRKSPGGEYEPARMGEVFQTGEEIRLRVEPNDSGYFYLFQRDSKGGLRLVSTGQIARGQVRDIPSQGALEYSEPGNKRLLLVFSRRPQPELAAPGTPELDALASRARSHIVQTASSSEDTAYAVDAGLQPSEQRVAVEISLEFR